LWKNLLGTEVTGGVIKTADREIIFPLTEIVSKNEFFDFNAKYKREADEITPQESLKNKRLIAAGFHL
jgi:D-alanine-D-alanine ligase